MGASRTLAGVAGRIRDEDVALVRERSPIAEVIAEHLTLRNAGGGSLKGLCPFHDEKTPSFNVTPARGFFHCFGCQEGGDVIDFVCKIEHLGFAEAVERLAARAGVTLRYEEGGVTPGRQQGQRTRLLEAHRDAAQFYAGQLDTPDAAPARRFLAERGFDRDAAARFGVGYAPRSWDALVKHLRGRGFTDEELLVGGLARTGPRGLLDRFVGRLLWPISDITGDPVGFGARRLYDDDRIEAKYLNTAETPIFKKSSLLYGLDLAKREISRRSQAVVVEGYTDVMACHLAGVQTAVATCGTAFGEEHVKVIRRVLMDQDESRGEVIFTFDGDAAGQKAALKAFEHDQRFVAQTFVAVEPDGMDPCELRQVRGDEAVRELVARRVPLFEFAIRGRIRPYDLDSAEGRTAARHAGMQIVRGIRDVALRLDYARRLAGWLGLPDPDELVAEARGGLADARPRRGGPAPVDPRDPELLVEREALKIALQEPHLAGDAFDALDPAAFRAAPYAAVRAAISAAGGAANAVTGEVWVAKVRTAAADDTVRRLVAELAVEPVLRPAGMDPATYAGAQQARLEELTVTRRIAEVKSRLQRLSPVEQLELYNRTFGDLVALEAQRRTLRERAMGAV